jgi:2-keto-4-pentenoate hydratase/2-oxohepta-3-ene-1,7-dioic acid hydratase in catechol pathway
MSEASGARQWVRYEHLGVVGFGTQQGEQVQPHQGDMFAGAQAQGPLLPMDQLQLLSPCVPTKFFALWNNFRAAAQKNGWAEPAEPLYFLKSANSFAAHAQPVIKPACYGGRVLYEGELGIVIGKRGRDIAPERAAEHVFGVTCVNDVTALDLLRADASFEQWTRAKSFDGFTPFGPCIATGLDLASLSVRTLLNGRERQNYPASDMFFSPLELVSRLSRGITLEPGDVISCGTSLGALPWGAGVAVEVHIDGVGLLKNTLMEETAT